MSPLTAIHWLQVLTTRRSQGAPRELLLDDICTQVRHWQAEGQLDALIRHLLILVGVDRLLPAKYAAYSPLLLEGMAFVLSQLSSERLAAKVLDQAELTRDASSGERICTLIRDMPTLQKLGQILARDPGLDPEFRQSLRDLEDNIRSVSYRDLQPMIQQAAAAWGGNRLEPEPKILAEATVCAVVGAAVHDSERDRSTAAVLKMVKPAVQRNLSRELEVLDRLARFLDDNASRWNMGSFKFQETFEQVRWCLEKEIDLGAEQENLRTAGDYYREQNSRMEIPRPLAGSSAQMTIMSREEGHKITAVEHLDADQRRALAMAISRSLILEPITSLAPLSIFHGDPHAGNIAYRFDGEQPHLILYDWGMMGRLQPMERLGLVLMALGIGAQSTLVVMFAADLIAQGNISADQELSTAVTRAIDGILARRQNRFADILATQEKVFESLTRQGIALPVNLLMFKKAQFTLKGVLAAIDPTFKRDQYLIWAAAATFVRDFAHLRYQRMVMGVAWELYRHSLGRIFRLQKQLMLLFRETSLWLLKMPFQILEDSLDQPQLAYVPLRSHSTSPAPRSSRRG